MSGLSQLGKCVYDNVNGDFWRSRNCFTFAELEDFRRYFQCTRKKCIHRKCVAKFFSDVKELWGATTIK